MVEAWDISVEAGVDAIVDVDVGVVVDIKERVRRVEGGRRA